MTAWSARSMRCNTLSSTAELSRWKRCCPQFYLESFEGVIVARLADAGLISMADIAAGTGQTRGFVQLLISGERGPPQRIGQSAVRQSTYRRHPGDPVA